MAIVGCGALLSRAGEGAAAVATVYVAHPWLAFAGALTPVMFAYGGWQTASFAAADMRDPARDLSRAMLFGVLGVVALYLTVNVAFLLALGPAGLAATVTPATAVVARVAHNAGVGAMVISGFIALSTFGFLSQGLFAVPRLYQAMGADGLFFRAIGRCRRAPARRSRRSRCKERSPPSSPATGQYESIMSYVISVDFVFYGLAALALFVFRARAFGAADIACPGHPFTTLFSCSRAGQSSPRPSTMIRSTVSSDSAHSRSACRPTSCGHVCAISRRDDASVTTR